MLWIGYTTIITYLGGILILNLFAYFIIPLFTIYFVSGHSLFTTNFSVIGNLIGRNEEFVFWGLLVGIFFYVCLRKINKQLKYLRGFWLIPLALGLLSCSVITPYLPTKFPFQSFLHSTFAGLSSACLLLYLYLLIWQLYQAQPTRYLIYGKTLIFITIICFLLFLLVGMISSALEIFFTLSTICFVRQLEKEVRR